MLAATTGNDENAPLHGAGCACGICGAPAVTFDKDGLMRPAGPGRGEGDYQLGGRWSNTATNGFTGSSGNPVTLTWGFVNDGLSIDSGVGEPVAASNLKAALNSTYGSQATWLPLFQSVFADWSAKTGINYVYQPTDDGAAWGSASGQLDVRADVRIGGKYIDGAYNTLAYNYFPGGGVGGDMVIDTAELATGGLYRQQPGNNHRAFRNTIAHEHGHGLGLNHVIPVNNTKLMEPSLSVSFELSQFDDVLAVQSAYGDPNERNGRNENAATATNVGTLADGTNASLATGISVANTSDNDYFKFTLANNRTVSLTATPYGPTYQQGPQGGSATTFNAAAQGNLTLTVYATNGTTVLQTTNLTGLGSAETISNLGLGAGTYYARVTSSSGGTQMYTLSANVIAPVAPVAPSTPALETASDSGTSSIDGITNDATPTYAGTAAGQATVTLFANGAAIGSTTAGPDGFWSITPTVALTDGSYAITAIAANEYGTSTNSAASSLTIDTAAPIILNRSYDRDLTQDFFFTFDENVASQLSSSELSLVNRTTGTTYATNFLTVNATGNQARVLAAFGLPDGRYELSFVNLSVTDVAGNAVATSSPLSFTQLVGDANNDATVNFADLVILAQNYNTSGKTFSQGNFDYSAGGGVDFQDLVLLAQRYNYSLPALPPPVAPMTSSASFTLPTEKPAVTTGGKPQRVARSVLV